MTPREPLQHGMPRTTGSPACSAMGRAASRTRRLSSGRPDSPSSFGPGASRRRTGPPEAPPRRPGLGPELRRARPRLNSLRSPATSHRRCARAPRTAQPWQNVGAVGSTVCRRRSDSIESRRGVSRSVVYASDLHHYACLTLLFLQRTVYERAAASKCSQRNLKLPLYPEHPTQLVVQLGLAHLHLQLLGQLPGPFGDAAHLGIRRCRVLLASQLACCTSQARARDRPPPRVMGKLCFPPRRCVRCSTSRSNVCRPPLACRLRPFPPRRSARRRASPGIGHRQKLLDHPALPPALDRSHQRLFKHVFHLGSAALSDPLPAPSKLNVSPRVTCLVQDRFFASARRPRDDPLAQWRPRTLAGTRDSVRLESEISTTASPGRMSPRFQQPLPSAS